MESLYDVEYSVEAANSYAVQNQLDKLIKVFLKGYYPSQDALNKAARYCLNDIIDYLYRNLKMKPNDNNILKDVAARGCLETYIKLTSEPFSLKPSFDIFYYAAMSNKTDILYYIYTENNLQTQMNDGENLNLSSLLYTVEECIIEGRNMSLLWFLEHLDNIGKTQDFVNLSLHENNLFALKLYSNKYNLFPSMNAIEEYINILSDPVLDWLNNQGLINIVEYDSEQDIEEDNIYDVQNQPINYEEQLQQIEQQEEEEFIQQRNNQLKNTQNILSPCINQENGKIYNLYGEPVDPANVVYILESGKIFCFDINDLTSYYISNNKFINPLTNIELPKDVQNIVLNFYYVRQQIKNLQIQTLNNLQK